MINRRYARVLWNAVRERHFTNEATLKGFEPTFEISQRCTISAQPCAILRVTSETVNQPVCIAQNNALPVSEIVRKAKDAKQQFAGLVSQTLFEGVRARD